jgi:hypothetical protein
MELKSPLLCSQEHVIKCYPELDESHSHCLKKTKKTNSMVWVREWTITTERRIALNYSLNKLLNVVFHPSLDIQLDGQLPSGFSNKILF